MSSSKQYKLILSIAIAFAVIHSTPLSTALAVVPPPDGGYPGGNTAEGQNALFSLTSGIYNTAVGWFSLRSNTEGQFNTAIGAGALLANLGNSGTSDGIQNTATGAGALLSNTTGEDNTANGAFALVSNTTGDSNTASGAFALQNNTTGSFNIAVGLGALLSNTTGFSNTAIGTNALVFNTEGNFNTAIGDLALRNNTAGRQNTAIGESALFHNTTADNNTAIGDDALFDNTTGINNTANGVNALFSNTTGDQNTAVGVGALLNNTDGNDNIAIGPNALSSSTSGNANIAVGLNAGTNVNTASNVICIGAIGADESNSCFIGNIFDQTSSGGAAVFVNAQGRLGTATSARRFKEGINPMANTSEALFALKPVTFHYKSDKASTAQFGLIAEEVAKVNADLVVRDNKGQVYTVRYDAVNAMLLNEFLKEHKKVQAQGATIAGLKKEIATLTAIVKEQTAQIQKVNAPVEASRSTPRMVRNHREGLSRIAQISGPQNN